MTSPADDDIERDARLLAALRHAPDAALEPPPSVSTRILAQARAAARNDARSGPIEAPRQAGVAPSWRERLQRWLAPRAPWAAAFGTIVAAALVGVLWSGAQPPADESVPSPTVPGGVPAPREADGAAAAPTPAAAPPPAAEPEAANKELAERRQRTTSPEAPRPGARSAAPPPANAPAVAATRPTAPPAAAPTAVDPAPARKAAVEGAGADAATAPPVGRAADLGASPARAERPSASASMVAPRDAPGAGAAAGRADPSARLDAALRAAALDAAVWRHAGRTHAHGGEQRLWWSQVGDATQGRWQAVPDGRGDTPEPWMVLSIGAGRVAAFWFVGDVLWLRDGAGLWRVPVSSAQRRTWQAAPERW